MITGSVIKHAAAMASKCRSAADTIAKSPVGRGKPFLNAKERTKGVIEQSSAATAFEHIAKDAQEPSVQANVVFVEYGYQIDVLIDGEPAATVCRDFGGDYPIDDMAAYLAARLIDVMAGFEKDFRRNSKVQK